MLAGHRTASDTPLAVTFPPAVPASSEEALARYRIVSSRPAGRRVEYRNVNYALLGAVVSRVANTEYSDFVAQHVFAPLGVDVAFSRLQ